MIFTNGSRLFHFLGINTTENLSWSSRITTMVKKSTDLALLYTDTYKVELNSRDPGQRLQRSHRNHPDRQHHKLTWFITALDRKALQRLIKSTRTSLVPY